MSEEPLTPDESKAPAGGVAHSLANQVSQMAQNAIREQGNTALDSMGPGSGLHSTPLDNTGQPRTWQYRPGWNLPMQPGEGRVSYATLQQIADMYDICRKAIEFRKDELCSLPWDITVRESDKRKQRDLVEQKRDTIQKIKSRFQKPDGRNTFQSWLRKGIEDYFVGDYMSLATMRNLRGDVLGWKWIDGSTIKVRIDATGEIPMRPGIAYQQYLYGYPRFDFFEGSDPTEYRESLRRWRNGDGWLPDAMYGPNLPDLRSSTPGELRYRPRNRRNRTVYGFSHIEGLLTHINIALRWQLWEQAFWIEGNIPSSIMAVPPDWSQPAIEEYQAYWDAVMSGDPGKQRSMRFVPGGSKVFDIEPALSHSTDFAQYLMTITLMIFDVNRAEIGLEPLNSEGLGGKGHAEGQAKQSKRASLIPLCAWLKSEYFDPLIQEDLGCPDLEWVWPSLLTNDAREQGETNQLLLYSGQKALDEVITEQGGDPIGVGRMMVLGSQLYMEKDLVEMAKKGALTLQMQQQQQMAQAQGKVQQDAAAHQSGLNKDEASHEAKIQPDKPPSNANKSAEGAGTHSCSCGCSLDKATGMCAGHDDDDCSCDKCHAPTHDHNDHKSADLDKWERKAVKAAKAGKSASVSFNSDYIDERTRRYLGTCLTKAASPLEVRIAFLAARSNTFIPYSAEDALIQE